MATFIKTGFWEKRTKPAQGYKGELNLDQLIQSNSSALPYKVFSALVTQSGDDNPDTSNGQDPFFKGWTYQINSNPDNEDLTPYGAPNNNVGTYFICNSNVPPNTFSINLSLSYNTGAPVAIVLENTVGNIWFEYTSNGRYSVKSDGLFLGGKTFCTIGNIIDLDGYAALAGLTYQSDVTVQVETTPFQSGTNGLLSNTPMEIRVYN